MMVPTDAPIGADIAHLEAIGILERWQLMGPLPRGRFIAGGRGVHIERLVRTLMVDLVAAVGELLLLGAQGGAGRSGGVGFQGAMPARVAAVLGRFAGFDALRQDAPAHPPCGQLGPPGQGGGVANGTPWSVRMRCGRPHSLHTRVKTGLASCTRGEERAWHASRKRL